MRLWFPVTVLLALCAAGLAIAVVHPAHEASGGDYSPPDGALVTYFTAPKEERGLPLVVSGSIEPGFMRPFLLAFQQQNPSRSIAYIQSRNEALLESALAACREGERTADVYVTSSTDQLIRLANKNCAATMPATVGRSAPAQASWRNQVVAFTVEPAAFVFSRRSRKVGGVLPSSHIQLLAWLRGLPPTSARIGTFDIEASADGYDFAAADSRQAALYGRLLESFARANVRLYCCSNVMVDAVDRDEILAAYNVQLSYAYAAQRAGSRIVVILPDDYQALQTVSFMLPKGARDPANAVKLARFLVSNEARTIARRKLAPPDLSPGQAAAQADQLLDQASVSPILLSLQDKARREHLVREWREATGSLKPRALSEQARRPLEAEERTAIGDPR